MVAFAVRDLGTGSKINDTSPYFQLIGNTFDASPKGVEMTFYPMHVCSTLELEKLVHGQDEQLDNQLIEL